MSSGLWSKVWTGLNNLIKTSHWSVPSREDKFILSLSPDVKSLNVPSVCVCVCVCVCVGCVCVCVYVCVMICCKKTAGLCVVQQEHLTEASSCQMEECVFYVCL